MQSFRPICVGLIPASVLCLSLSVAASSTEPEPPADELPGRGGLVGEWPNPQAPVGNEADPVKARLGKLLFWDEQVSFDRTMACGTCHIPAAGGSDPRTTRHPAGSEHPNRFGSPGVVRQDIDGNYVVDANFLLEPQITGRLAPTPIGAAFMQKLFWDISAEEDFAFFDVDGNMQVLWDSAALESLSVRPPVSSVEMGHDDMEWTELEERLGGEEPMALASDLSGDFVVTSGETYSDLFEEAFGSPEVTEGRFAMAVAQYMRELVPDQAPIDDGLYTLSSEAQHGFELFNSISTDPNSGCVACHQTFEGTDSLSTIEVDEDGFFVEPNDYLFTSGTTEDALVDPIDDRDVQFAKTSGLRNVALQDRLESQGRFAGIEDALDSHYLQDDMTEKTFGAGTEEFRDDILAFFDALVDTRVAAETAPFDRPTLYSELVPFGSNILGNGTLASTGRIPEIIANTPPLIGNPDFKLGIGLAEEGSTAVLYSSDALVSAPGGSEDVQWEIDEQSREFTFEGSVTLDGETEVPGIGVGTLYLPIPDDSQLSGETRYFQWAVRDRNAAGGYAMSRVAEVTYF